MIPLSFAQRGLWFVHQMNPESSMYTIQLASRLTGGLDRPALEAALRDVVQRHEALRTVFRDGEDEPHQVILDIAECAMGLEYRELSEHDLRRAMNEASERPFDLARDLPIRAWLFALGPQEHVLLISMHHIISDGWSLGPLTRDLAAAYSARSRGEAPRLAPLPVQYADYVLWQRQLLGREEEPESLVSQQLRYWRDALDGMPEELRLPVDRPRRPVSDFASGTIAFRLDAELHAALAEVARGEKSTMFMVLQAGFAVLLGKLGAGCDIPIGTPVAGRMDDALTDLVGFFINTLVLRTDVSGDPSLRDLVKRVQAANLEAYDNQDVPFDRLVDALNPSRSLSRHPLFQVMFALQNNASAGLEFEGLIDAPVDIDAGSSRFDLVLSLMENFDADKAPAGIEAFLEYQLDMFDRETAQGIADGYPRVLAALAADPDAPIGTVDLLSPQQRAVMLETCNRTEVPVAATNLPELFEARAASAPGATAVSHLDRALTYGELNARANRLARHLRTLGANSEQVVAVALSSSEHLVVALLAVLKSGAAYLPVDPAYPAERIDFMLSRAEPVLLITDAAFPLSGEVSVARVSIDAADTAEALAGFDDANLTAAERGPIHPHHTAYVMFTSGSTGDAKAVAVEHANLANYLAWSVDAFPAADGTVIMHSSISFDFTITALFTPLVAGGHVRVASLDIDSADPESDAAAGQCTFLKVTPSHLPLVSELSESYLPTRQLLLCGEPLIGAALLPWKRQHPEVRIFNGYGPTETTVESMCHSIEPGRELESGPVPLGTPVWNTRVYVLDDHLRPVPYGVPGELYIAGAGVARGYRGESSLTSHRFVADPFGAPATRMYRTGDLARRRRDGELEFLGRADDQMKVRGHRVEPAEVEAVLSRHQDVEQVAVTAQTDRNGDRLLVAYVVPAHTGDVHVADLRSYVAGLLPSYMVPSAFVLLTRLPTTPNGKLDRAALPVPDLSETAIGDGAKPRDAREEVLCKLYAELLGVPEVGINSSFFDLGGHSLLAARLTFRLRKLFGEEIAVGMVFANPSVSQLAAALDADATAVDGAAVVRERVESAREELTELIATLGTPPPPVAAEHLMDRVLLTGATGYLGTFLLHELLESTRAHVWCLVRAADAAQGLERLRENLARFGRATAELDERVTVLVGDLAQPRLGLTEEEFGRLGESITTIYHNGAAVNLVLPYDSVKGANLNSTRELLRLASTFRTKPLHLISTDAIPRNIDGNGYVLSKEMAEEVVRAARAHGYPGSVFRMPRLSIDSKTGRGNHRDAALRLLRMVVEVGAAPDIEFEEMWIPVDEAARLVVQATVSDPDCGPHSVVTDEPTAWSSVIRLCVESDLGTVVSPPAQWSELVRRGGSAENEVMLSVIGLDEPEGEQDEAPSAPYGDPAAFGRVLSGPRVSDASLLAFLRAVRIEKEPVG
jgi:nonribosomal peptide synthetase DhbF